MEDDDLISTVQMLGKRWLKLNAEHMCRIGHMSKESRSLTESLVHVCINVFNPHLRPFRNAMVDHSAVHRID